jgi:hypothetical protein
MRLFSSRHPWRHYGTDALVILTGAIFALLCALLVLAQALFKFFILVSLGLCALGIALAGYFKKSARHA